MPLRSQGHTPWIWGRASGAPVGLVPWMRASSRVEAGTSRFLSISDSDHSVRAELGKESQASSWVEAWNSTCLSSCSEGDRPLVKLHSKPAGLFPDDARGCQCHFMV